MREAPSPAPSVTIAVDDPGFLRNPHELLAQMRALGPVVWNRATGMFVVTRYDVIIGVLQNPSVFSSRRDVDTREHLAPEARAVLAAGYSETSILVNDDPPTHTRLRALVNKAFSKAAIDALAPSIVTVADGLVAELAAARSADVVEKLAVPLPLTIICSVIGADPAHAPKLKQWSRSWAALTHDRSLLPREQVRCAEDLLAWQEFMGRLVEARRADPSADILSRMIEATEVGVGSLTTAEIAVFSMGLLFAGHETTTNLIANTVLHTIREGVWQKLALDPLLVPNAIEETLRFDPPVQGMIRRATREAEVAGVRIPPGEQLFLSFASANRDDSRYDDPHRFAIERAGEPLRHLGFGHGIHFCLGAQLARLEARAAVSALARTVRDPALVDTDLRYGPSLVHRGPQSLNITWHGGF
jgi:cytochrome P450